MPRIRYIFGLLLLCACAGPKSSVTPSGDLHAVAAAMSGLQVFGDSLEVTLFAAEPMISNPMGMDIDARGRVWVCEGYNYRNKLNPKNPLREAGDRIVILEDTDGDAVADKQTVFYQGTDVNAAHGIAVVGNRVIVSCSPNVLVFTDANGDDIPDSKDTMLTGIGGADHDHGVHGFVQGPDGKLYFNMGNEGKGLLRNGKPAKDPQGRVIADDGKPYRQGMALRCNSDGGLLEPLGWNFRNPNALCLDSYGRIWQSDNSDADQYAARLNYVMDYGNYGYQDEVSGAPWSENRTHIELKTRDRHWHQNDPGTVPNMIVTGSGFPTGICMYEGNLIPAFQGGILQCDAGTREVRLVQPEANATGYDAVPSIVLQGNNTWVRPTDVCVAPDGSVFVSDWYDPTIGNHAMSDVQRGRIYRIAPRSRRYLPPTYDFSTADGCAKALQSPTLSVQYQAHEALRKLGLDAENELVPLWRGQNTVMRARALWVLGKLPSGRGKTYLEQAALASDEHIRATAVRLARQFPRPPMAFYQQLANDISPIVRRELCFALRDLKEAGIADIWATLALKHNAGDRWYLEALGIAAEGNWDIFMGALLPKIGTEWQTDPRWQDIVWRARDAGNVNRLSWLIGKTTDTTLQNRYFRAFDFQSDKTEKTKLLMGLLAEKPSDRMTFLALRHSVPQQIKANETWRATLNGYLRRAPADAFCELVSRYDLKDQTAKLMKIAMQDADIQVAEWAAALLVRFQGSAAFDMNTATGDTVLTRRAIQVFGATDDVGIATHLIKLYRDTKLPTPLRQLAMMQMRGDRSEVLLWREVSAARVPDDVLPIAQKILLETQHADIRSEAFAFFGITEARVITDVNKLLNKKGDPEKGRAIAVAYCLSCHRIGSEGSIFGPDLTKIGFVSSKANIFNAIITPSKDITAGYEGLAFHLISGDIRQGISLQIANETITYIEPYSDMQRRLSYADVEKIEKLAYSLMPTLQLPQQDLINLVAYLEQLK